MSQTSHGEPARPSRSRSGGTRKNARGETTRQLILTAAERLFAERGISAVPMRDIGLAAGQRNHTAVRYHFGERDEVVSAIMEFRGAQSEATRVGMVADLMVAGSPAIRDVVSAFVRPLAIHIQPDNHYLAFLSLYITEEGGYEGLAHVNAGASVVTLRALLGRLLPEIPTEVLDERWWLTLTSAVHALARYHSARRHARLPGTIGPLIDDMVSYLSAGLSAPLSDGGPPNVRGDLYAARMANHTNPGTGEAHPDSDSPDPASQDGKPPDVPAAPHDALFHLVFDSPEHAASEFRAVLPPEVTSRLDLDSLEPVDGSFVDRDLRSLYTDVLYSVPMDGHDAFIYILMEHQRKDDAFMAFRMLQYVVRIWAKYLKQHPEAQMLPPVIPLVVYNGDRRWRSPCQVLDLISLDEDGKKALEPVLPRFEFLLDDLNDIDEEQLRARQMTEPAVITLVLLKETPGNPRIAEDLRRWEPELHVVVDQYGQEMFQGMLTYIWNVGGAGEAAREALHKLATSLGKDAEESFMTIAESFRTEVQADMLVRMLTAKFGPLPDSVSEKVQEASGTQVQEWAIRAMTAEKLDDIFD